MKKKQSTIACAAPDGEVVNKRGVRLIPLSHCDGYNGNVWHLAIPITANKKRGLTPDEARTLRDECWRVGPVAIHNGKGDDFTTATELDITFDGDKPRHLALAHRVFGAKVELVGQTPK
jgi:hypothetical protein